MKINRALLKDGVSKTFEDSIDFSSIELNPSHIRKIVNCDVVAEAVEYDSLFYVKLHIKSLVIGVCSYSLEDVEINLNINDEITFSDNEDDEDTYYSKDMLIDLDEYILGILLAHIPVKIVKKGAKLPKDGKGYRVLTQDEYEKEKEKEVDHRWDALDNIEIDDK